MSLGDGLSLSEVLADASASGHLFRDGEPDTPVAGKKGLFTWRPKKMSVVEDSDAAPDKAAVVAPASATTTPTSTRKTGGIFALRKRATKVSERVEEEEEKSADLFVLCRMTFPLRRCRFCLELGSLGCSSA